MSKGRKKRRFRVVIPTRPYIPPSPERLALYETEEWKEKQRREIPKRRGLLASLGFTRYEIGFFQRIDFSLPRMRRVLREQRRRIRQKMEELGVSWHEAVKIVKAEGEAAVRHSELTGEYLDPKYDPYYRLYPELIVF